jgi:hypothetical protein
VVVRVGDGSTALTNTATAAFLESRSVTDGSLLSSPVALPTAAAGSNARLTLTGSATTEGALARSADGHYVSLAGYDAAVGTAAVSGSTSATVNRVVGRVDASGTVDTTTRIDALFSAANVRAAVTNDGTSFWAAGSASGVVYLPFGTTGGTQLLATPANLRACEIVASQLYCSSGTGPFTSVFTVGGGTPTTAGQTATLLPGLPTSGASPYAFVLLDTNPAVPGVDTLYLADDRAVASGGGLQKWTFDGTTSTFTLAATFTNGLTAGLRGVTGWVEGANVVLFVTEATTSGNRLLSFVDDGSIDPAFTTLATAPANTAFRGVAAAPR